MSASTIYNQLCLAGMSPVGACAMLGNMQAESGLQSNIAQRGMTSLSDEAYTLAADRGTIGFATDAVGYGLCQWTYCTRKAGLLSFAKQRGKSVGDEQTQVYYCIRELQDDFSALWSYLRKTDDIDTATDRICAEFERPAVNNFLTRREHAKRYYAELTGNAMSLEIGADERADRRTGQDPVPTAQTPPPQAVPLPLAGEVKTAAGETAKLLFERVVQIGLVGLGYDADRDYDTAVRRYAADIA